MDRRREEAATLAAPARRNSAMFSAGQMTRLNEDWGTSISSADLDLWANLIALRGRMRRLANNNPLVQKYLRMCQKNIAGTKGIQLQVKIPMKKGKKINKKLSQDIEKAWLRWCRKENCTVKGNMTFGQAQRFAVEQWKRDGECFVRMVIYDGNPFNFSLQFFDPDQLDTNFFNYTMPGGATIRMGVESDKYGKPVAYWFWNKHPAEVSATPRFRIRVPAEEVVHLYKQQRCGQTRGYPECSSSMISVHMIGKYAEAEIAAARLGAERVGFFESATTDEGYQGERDADDNIKMRVEPGMLESLPVGVSFKAWDANHPNQAFPFFMKSQTRMAGAGMDVSYESLANDREGVNYSSIRAGLLDERDTWRVEQDHMISIFCETIQQRWLEIAWLAGQITLPNADLPQDYYEFMNWHARGWPWVDPLKDVQAAVLMNENGYISMSQQMAESGNDFEETIDEIGYEQEYVKAAGVKIGTDTKGVADTADDDADPPAGGTAGKDKDEN